MIAGGVAVEGEAAKVVQGVPTAGAVPSGARVEREVSFDFSTMTGFRLALRDADFTTAARIEAVINDDLGPGVAELLDAGTVSVDPSSLGTVNPARLAGRIENLTVEPEARARVVVDHRSGTIVVGEDVRISRVAVSQGSLTLRVREAPVVSQPNPFARGETIVAHLPFSKPRFSAKALSTSQKRPGCSSAKYGRRRDIAPEVYISVRR